MELKKRTLSVNSVMIIVLAVLLVLSIGVGFTGAWFTDKAEFEQVDLGEIKLGKIEVSAVASDATLYGSTYTGGEYVKNAQPETTRTKVLPGDYITATIKVTNTSTADAYILVYDKAESKWYNLEGTEITEGGSLEATKESAGVGGTFNVEGSVATTETDQSQELSAYIQFNYDVVACQAANISQADAWGQLKALVAAQAQ